MAGRKTPRKTSRRSVRDPLKGKAFWAIVDTYVAQSPIVAVGSSRDEGRVLLKNSYPADNGYVLRKAVLI